MGEIQLPEPAGRVAVAGDWGGAGVVLSTILPAIGAAGVTQIVHAGDMFARSVNIGFALSVEAVAREHGINRIDLVAGNHDSPGLGELRARAPGQPVPLTRNAILHLLPRVSAWTWAGRRWMGVAGAVSLDHFTRSAPAYDPADEAVLGSDVEAARALGAADVLVSHDAALRQATPAVEAIRRGGGGRWSEHALAEARQSATRLQEIVDGAQSQLLLHGHMHVADRATVEGVEVVSLGAERAPGNTALIELTTLTAELLTY